MSDHLGDCLGESGVGGFIHTCPLPCAQASLPCQGAEGTLCGEDTRGASPFTQQAVERLLCTRPWLQAPSPCWVRQTLTK